MDRPPPDQPFEFKRISSPLKMPPQSYRATSPSPMPSELPGSPMLPETTDLTLRRPAPYALGPASLSADSRLSSLVSPQTNSSSTSYSAVDQPRSHIVIGIDFGTTYSGVSWAISGKHEADINTVTNWPNGQFAKVPTQLSYDKETIQWGYAMSPDAERLSWFKLLLAEEHLPPKIRDSKQLRATRRLLQKLGKGAVEVTADYLKKLWEWVLADIKKAWPAGVDRYPFRVVLSVPANWPKTAVDNMKAAAAQAGLLNRRAGGLETSLEFVGEPEAAAIAAFYEEKVRYDVRTGDIIIICDAGGGTVDIVTYEVNGVSPSISLGEYIDGDMGLCGSLFLDENFINFIEGMLGRDKLMKLPKAAQGELMEAWEHKIKRQFNNDTIEIAPRIPYEVAKAIKSPLKVFKKGKGGKQLIGNTFHFSSADIRHIFDPVMTDILKLVYKQKNGAMTKRGKKPKAILLVGGLGENQFLYDRLYKEFTMGDGISVVQQSGPNTWATICRGAAIKGMTFDDFHDLPLPVVTSYISKAHYGMMYKEPFDSSKHTSEDRREYCPARQVDLAWDQMHWYVTKGNDVSQGDPVEMTWEFAQPESRPQDSYSITIYECEVANAPTRRTNDVHECATISFTARQNNASFRDGAGGQRFRIIHFTLRMTLLGLGRLEFATYVDGRAVAQRDVRVKLGGE